MHGIDTHVVLVVVRSPKLQKQPDALGSTAVGRKEDGALAIANFSVWVGTALQQLRHALYVIAENCRVKGCRPVLQSGRQRCGQLWCGPLVT